MSKKADLPLAPVKFRRVKAYGAAGGWAREAEVMVRIEGHADTVAQVEALVGEAPDLLEACSAAQFALSLVGTDDPKGLEDLRRLAREARDHIGSIRKRLHDAGVINVFTDHEARMSQPAKRGA